MTFQSGMGLEALWAMGMRQLIKQGCRYVGLDHDLEADQRL